MPQLDLLNTLAKMTSYLERHSIEQPRLASEILVSKTLGLSRIEIYTHFDRPVSETELDAIRIKGRRLAEGEPLQLIVEDTQFLSYTFRVRRGVFIPRPETEILVDTAAQRLKPLEKSDISVLDLCTGSGVIAISLLKLIPHATATATDISEDALALASENARLLGVSDRFSSVRGDIFSPVPPGTRFDAVLSNPPYITSREMEYLPNIVKEYDPRAALDGGPDGLDIVRRIISQAPDHLKPGGFLAIEIGAGQSRDVMNLMHERGLTNCGAEQDFNGIERVITGCHE